MNWSELPLTSKNELMKLYIQNGITSLDEIKKHYNSFATGGNMSPDHDPNNPYHYHDAAGNKIVITPEEWEANVGKPYFREIENAVRAEQDAYPEPEYDEVENPAFIQAYNNLINKAAGKNGSLAVNWWNGKSYGYAPLPEGYSRDEYGVVTDSQGNYYTPLPNRNNSSFSIPYRDLHGNTTEQYYGRVDMPNKTIMQLRQPLPVDKVMDVNKEREESINNYINNNSITKYRKPYYIGTSPHYPTKKEVIIPYLPGPGYTGHALRRYTHEPEYNELLNTYINKEEISEYLKEFSDPVTKYLMNDLLNKTLIVDNKGKQFKPSREEAENKAVIHINPSEKVNTFADGGKLTFQQWKAQMQSKYPYIEMDNNKAGYDYETYFNDNYDEAIAQLSNLQHFPDTYKLYNHPTFSNESIYSRGPMIGGSWGYAHPWETQWGGTEAFRPSIVNQQVYPNIYKEDRPYTEEEIYGHKFDIGGPTKNSKPAGWDPFTYEEYTKLGLPMSKTEKQLRALRDIATDNPDYYTDLTGKDAFFIKNLEPVNIEAEHPIHDLPDVDENKIPKEMWTPLVRFTKDYAYRHGESGRKIALPLTLAAITGPLANGLSSAEIGSAASSLFNSTKSALTPLLNAPNLGKLGAGFAAYEGANSLIREYTPYTSIGNAINQTLNPGAPEDPYADMIYELGAFNTAGLVKNAFNPVISRGIDLGLTTLGNTVKPLYNSKAAPVLADASYKAASFNSDPIMKMLYNDYISGKPSILENMFPQKTIQTGLDDGAIQLLRNRTLNRNIQAIKESPNLSSSFLGESRVKKLNEIFDKDLPSIKVGKYSGQDYKNAGYEDWGGFYNEESQFISINKDSGMPIEKVEAHEGLHHIDSKHSLTDEQNTALSKAFDSDFNTLPETEYAPGHLKGYKYMRSERVTTNRDARDELLRYDDIPLEKQNQIIDQATDDEIFSAVENANGYGQAYIKRLRAENKLTHEKANAFRESMKKVGVIIGIIGTGAATIQK